MGSILRIEKQNPSVNPAHNLLCAWVNFIIPQFKK